jgi:hypothetical protein
LSGSSRKKQSGRRKRRRWLRRDLRGLPSVVHAFDLLRRCQWEDADDVLGQRVLISSVALDGHVRPVVGAGHPVLLGNGVSTYMGQEGLSQDVSYDVYVKLGVDHMGRPEFSDAIAHFREQRNAVTYKRQLEARGKTVHVQKNAVYDFSEAKKSEWFIDYEPKAPPADPPGTSRSAAEPNPPPPVDGSDSSDRRIEPWYRGWFGG